MVRNQTNGSVEVLHNKGCDRLLADMAESPDSCEAIAAELRRGCLETPGVTCYAICKSWCKYLEKSDEATEWRVTLFNSGVAGYGEDADPAEALAEARRRLTKNVREATIKARVEREVREAEAADRATRHEVTDDGNPSMLPEAFDEFTGPMPTLGHKSREEC